MTVLTNDVQMGRNICYLRNRAGLTCDQLARLLGMDSQELCLVEEGKKMEISGDALKNICVFFRISLEDIVGKMDWDISD